MGKRSFQNNEYCKYMYPVHSLYTKKYFARLKLTSHEGEKYYIPGAIIMKDSSTHSKPQ